jgi:hypothetical protein
MIANELMIGNPQKMVPVSGSFIYEKIEVSPYMTIKSSDGTKSGILMELPEELHGSNVVEVLEYCESEAVK